MSQSPVSLSERFIQHQVFTHVITHVKKALKLIATTTHSDTQTLSIHLLIALGVWLWL